MSVPIDLQHDKLLTLSQACKLLPHRPSPATLWRWRKKGILINGQRIKLQAVRAGGSWCTTSAAMADFIERQTEAASVPDDAPAGRTDATERRLQAAGLLKGDADEMTVQVAETLPRTNTPQPAGGPVGRSTLNSLRKAF